MLNTLPAELLERIFLRLPLWDLLECTRVSRRLQRAINGCTDWQEERLRFGVWTAEGPGWHGSEQSTGRQAPSDDPVQAGRLDAMLELIRSLSMEPELNALCTNQDPGNPPFEHDSTARLALTAGQVRFNGAHRLETPTDQRLLLVDPRLHDTRPERHFDFPPTAEGRHVEFLQLPTNSRKVIAVHRKEFTGGKMMFYLIDPLKDHGFSWRTIGSCEPYGHFEVHCFTWEDRLCVVLSQSAQRQAILLQLPGLEVVRTQQLSKGFLPNLLPHSQQSHFFLHSTPDSLQAYDVRTGELFCEFRVPAIYSLSLLSQNRRHLLVYAEQQLHVFDVPAEKRPASTETLSVSPSAVRTLDRLFSFHCRDGHIIALSRNTDPVRGSVQVFDLLLRPLWQLKSPISLTPIHFVGQSLFVTSSGSVYDWRRRRRFIGQVDYNVSLRLNRRRGAPCDHVISKEVGPCLDCAERRDMGSGVRLSKET